MFRPLSETKFINDANLISYYKLEETSGTTVTDSSGNGRNMTSVGATINQTGIFGKAYSFTESSKSDIYISNNLGLVRTSQSASFWIKLNQQITSAHSEWVFFHTNNATYGDGIEVGYQYNGGNYRMFVGYELNGSFFRSQQFVNITLTPGSWYHFTVTWNGGNSLILYKNGEYFITATQGLGTGASKIDIVSFGSRQNAYGYGNITIDDASIFNRVLSSAEVNELYQSYTLGEYIPTTNTKLLLHLNGNSTDSSGNGNNGTDTAITYGLGYGRFGQGATFTSSATSNIHGTNSITYSNITYSLWVKINAQPASGSWFFFIDNTGAIDGGIAYLNNSGQYRLYVYPNWVEYQIPLNTWINIIGVSTASNSKLYINGDMRYNTDSGRVGASTGYYIGNYHNLGSSYVTNGSIDEVIIENRAWSDAEIAKYYTMTKGRFGII